MWGASSDIARIDLICFSESGRIASRTVNTSATIDGPQPRPTVSWKNTMIASGISVKTDAAGMFMRISWGQMRDGTADVQRPDRSRPC